MKVASFTLGWNDRVRGRNFKAFRSAGGQLLMNEPRAHDGGWDWPEADRAEYVRGWEEAEAMIHSLELKEPGQ